MSSRLASSLLVLCILLPAAGQSQTYPEFQGDSGSKVEGMRQRVETQLIGVLDDLKGGLAGDEANVARKWKTSLKVVLPSRGQKRCSDAAELASLVRGGNEATFWICLQTLLSSRDLHHASGLLFLNTLLTKTRPSLKAGTDLIDYYANAHVRSNSLQALGERGIPICNSWNAAYLVSNGLDLVQCGSMSYYDSRSLDWASRLKKALLDKLAAEGDDVSEERKKQTAKDWLEEIQADTYVSVAAAALGHEIGHLVEKPATPQSTKEMLAIEDRADKFAMRLLAARDAYSDAALTIHPMAIFLMRVFARSAPTNKRMDNHLFARSVAAMRAVLCSSESTLAREMLSDKDTRAIIDAFEVTKICQ